MTGNKKQGKRGLKNFIYKAYKETVKRKRREEVLMLPDT